MNRTINAGKRRIALAIIATWLGPQMGYDGPAPIGLEAASRALGPQLVPDWDWPGQPTPTILLEGGPDDWAYRASMDSDVIHKFNAIGVYIEPYAGYALCLYPND